MLSVYLITHENQLAENLYMIHHGLYFLAVDIVTRYHVTP